MTSEVATQKTEARSKRSAVLLSLALGAALAALVALAGTARQAEAALTTKIVFDSNRTTGTGVNNPTGDYEIFRMNPDGSGVRQLTFNEGDDTAATLSPDGKKIAYQSYGTQTSNPQGDLEIYVMNALDGSDKRNLSNNGTGVEDHFPLFSPGGGKVVYESYGKQTSNPEGDREVYRVNVPDGSGKINLTNNGTGVDEYDPVFSPDGKKIAYQSEGAQNSNPEGDKEIYVMNSLDGKGKKDFTSNGSGIGDSIPIFSPDGKKIAYTSSGIQTSNPEGDDEVYRMNALDGSGKKNLSNNGSGINDSATDLSPDGQFIVYESYGEQISNLEGDDEVYVMNSLDGSGKINLSDNDVGDYSPVFSPDGKKIAYTSYGIQTSNPEGDDEVYRMNALDGSGKKNLSDNHFGDYSPEWGR